MSGHNKWSKIKHKKAANDAKKGKIFSKLSVQITQAAKQGGGDVEMNPMLRLYVDKAKSAGLPVDRIDKAIAKGTGEGVDGVSYEEATYEGFGPCGVGLVVDCLTDNKNRTVSELRKLFEEVGGSMGEEGSVSWNFDTKGLVVVKCGHLEDSEKFGEEPKFVADDVEGVMMSVMDVDGVMDIEESDVDGVKCLEVFCDYQDLTRVRDGILKLNYVLDEARIVRIPKMSKSLSDSELERVEGAIERLEDNDDVQDVWSDVG